jgi:amphiphysin
MLGWLIRWQIEHQRQVAERDYQNLNGMLKAQLAVFIQMRLAFIDPLLMSLLKFQSYFFSTLTEAYRPMEVYVQLHLPVVQGYEKRMELVLPMVEEIGVLKPLSPVKEEFQEEDWTTDANGNPFGTPSANPPAYGSVVTSPPPSGAWAPTASAAAVSSSNQGKWKMPAANPTSTPTNQPVSSLPAPSPMSKPSFLRSNAAPVAVYATALYDFDAQQDGDLPIRVGERIEIVAKTADADGWWRGRVNGREGLFPGNYVRLL